MFSKIIDPSKLKPGQRLYYLSSHRSDYDGLSGTAVKHLTVLRRHPRRAELVFVLGRNEAIDPNRFCSFLGMLLRQRTAPKGEVPFTLDERLATVKAARELRAMASEIAVSGNRSYRHAQQEHRKSRHRSMKVHRAAQRLEIQVGQLVRRRLASKKPAAQAG